MQPDEMIYLRQLVGQWPNALSLSGVVAGCIGERVEGMMKAKFYAWGTLFFVFSLALVACSEAALPGSQGKADPALTAAAQPTATSAPTPTPSGPKAGHWQGKTENTHWRIHSSPAN